MTNEGDTNQGDKHAGGAPPVARAPRGGRGLAALALLVALAALAGTGYLYWQQNLAARPVDPRLVALEQRVSGIDARLATAADGDAVRRDLERVAAELRAELGSRLDSVAGIGAAPPVAATTSSPRDWQLAEARYLLRMANHRVLLERDAPGAAALLRSADAVLVALDDFALHEVRARIAEEVLALESLPALDAEGLFLQLEAIKRDVDRLPLRMPEWVPEPAPPAEPAGLWDALRAEFDRLLRFRHFDGAVRPLLAPEEAVYLELNLRLMLERAQLAALRREQAIYVESIATASGWIERYLDVDTPEVRRVLDGLRALEGVNLAAPLPDVSGSLNALNAAVRPEP
jgi:uroporphyrin-3 C-methyltransferase